MTSIDANLTGRVFGSRYRERFAKQRQRDWFAVRRKLAGDARSIRALRSTVPESVETAVMHCLSVMPGDRGRTVPLMELP